MNDGYIPLRRGAGRLFDENLNRMLQELFLMLNTVDTGNSSEAAISGGGAFTGEWIDVSGFNSTMVAVATDADADDGTLFCRRFPPVGREWAQVQAEEWCAEHSSNLNKAPARRTIATTLPGV